MGGCLALYNAQDRYKSDKYKLEIYWTKKSIGFRQKTGEKRQLFSIGGATCKLSMDVLLGWAEEALKRLDSGKSPKSVCEWVKRQTSE